MIDNDKVQQWLISICTGIMVFYTNFHINCLQKVLRN